MEKILEEEAQEEWDSVAPKVRGVEATWRTEKYKVEPQTRCRVLQQLGLKVGDFEVDLFATERNTHCTLFCSPERDAFAYDWSTLGEKGGVDLWLWANPPFSMLLFVLAKILQSRCRIIVVMPNWPWHRWFGGLQVLSQAQIMVPERESMYLTEEGRQLPGPGWGSVVLRIDTDFVTPEARRRAHSCVPEKVSEWLSAKETRDKGDLELQVWGESMVRTLVHDDSGSTRDMVAPTRTRAEMAGEEPEILPLPTRRRRNDPVEEEYSPQPDLNLDEGEGVQEGEPEAEPELEAQAEGEDDFWVEVPGGGEEEGQSVPQPAENDHTTPETTQPEAELEIVVPITEQVHDQGWEGWYATCPTWGPIWRQVNEPDADWVKGIYLDRVSGRMEQWGKVCVPRDIVHNVVVARHEGLGHVGQEKQWLELNRAYVWPCREVQVRRLSDKVCRLCVKCQALKHHNFSMKTKLEGSPIPAELGSSVAIDICFMPAKEWEGVRYDCMVLAVDRLSGWTLAVPTDSGTALAGHA